MRPNCTEKVGYAISSIDFGVHQAHQALQELRTRTRVGHLAETAYPSIFVRSFVTCSSARSSNFFKIRLGSNTQG
eukprot:1760138-Rhodomonas_salina.1